jgi:hypothetical protein
MYGPHLRPFEVSATGDVFDSGDANTVQGLAGVRLVAAAANATAIVRETDGAGPVLVRLAALANDADDFTPQQKVAFKGKLHVTLTGAGAVCQVFI